MHDSQSMDIRRLEQWVAVAEEGSFMRAAERTHLSQSALTRAIQGLEQELDVRLFERGRHGVVPTVSGRQLLDCARRVLFEARTLLRNADLVRHDQLGEVCFGAGSYPSAILLPGILTTLVREYPDIKVKVEVNDWATLQRKVLDQEIEFAVVEKRTVPPDPSLESRPLSVEPAGWYVNVDHPLAERTSLTTRELRGYPLVSVPLPAKTRAHLQRRLGLTPGETLELNIECNDLHALREVVLNSDAILSATATLCRQELADGRLTRLNIPDNHQIVSYVLIHPAGQTLTPIAQRIVALIEQLAAQR